MIRGAVAGVALLASACQLAGPPQLVRDAAGMFSVDARAEAESRLRTLAAEHGVWTFVITEVNGDPPRMLDAPMQEADSLGVRAVAILFDADRIVGAGFSRASSDRGESLGNGPPIVDDLLARGDTDEALERAVDFLESWAASPPGEPPPIDVVEGPSGTPAP